jgi:carbon storage regulator
MLVLSRKQKERILINDNVVVTVLRIRGSQVTLGIEAPGEVTVHRSEVYKKITGREVPTNVAQNRDELR